MQLDQARIAIRYRTRADVVDLALKTLRVFAGPLLAWLAVGAAPFFLLNSWLLADLRFYDFVWGFPLSYMILVTLLVFLETPLATAMVTLFLGQAVFAPRADRRAVLRDLGKSLHQLLVFQVLLRPITVFYPFLNEVILLERNPIGKGHGETSTWARNRELHRDESGDLVVGGLANFFLGLILFGATWFSLLLLRTVFLGNLDALDGSTIGRPMYTTWYHVLLWAVAGFTTVVRFLSYLNLRIRREGWDVELQVRAEKARMIRHAA